MISILMLVIINVLWRAGVDRLSPGSLFFLFWFVQVTIYEILYFDVSKLLGSLYICIAVAVFVLSSAIFKKTLAYESSLIVKTHTVVIFSFLSNAVFLSFLYDQGVAPQKVLHDFYDVASGLIEKRYSRSFNRSYLTYAMYPIIYSSHVMLGNWLSNNRKGILTFCLVVLTFVPSVSLVVVASTKGAFLLALVLTVGGYVYASVGSQRISFLKFMSFKNLTLLILILFGIGFSFYLRGLKDSSLDYIIWKIGSYFASYSTGHSVAFNDWFAYYLGLSSQYSYTSADVYFLPVYTFYTFSSFIDNTTSQIVPVELYTDYVVFFDFIKTNIYTIFRGMIIDFGILGPVVFMFILGMVFNGFWSLYKRGFCKYLSYSMLMTFWFFMYQSFIASPFNYLSFVGFFVVLYVGLLMNRLSFRKNV